MAAIFIGGGNWSTWKKPPHDIVSSTPSLSRIQLTTGYINGFLNSLIYCTHTILNKYNTSDYSITIQSFHNLYQWSPGA